MLPALIAAELSLVTMTVFDQGVQQRDTRKIAKRARDCFHMVESTPPKRRRSRGHKHHRVRTGQHTAVAIGCCHLGMQGSVVEQLRQIRCQTALARILVRLDDARQRMCIDGTRQAAIERLGHCRRRALDRALGTQQIPKRGAASDATMTRIDERERCQTILADQRTGTLAASASRGRQRLERLVCHVLGKR